MFLSYWTSSCTCSTLHWVTDGAVACPIWGLNSEIVKCSTIKALDGAAGIYAFTVQHVSIFGLGTAIVVHSVISGSPWQQCGLIITVWNNWETIWLAGTWTEKKDMIKLLKQISFGHIWSTYECTQVFSIYIKTTTCVKCSVLTGFAGAVLVAGSHRYVILLATVELRYAAVTGGGVACYMSICAHCDHMICFSYKRGAPGHQCTVVRTGWPNHHHVTGWTRLCGK